MKQHRKTEIEDLAQVLANTVKGVRPARVRLRVIEPPRPTRFDSITRDSCLRRIRFLARTYSLQWLLEQETFDTPGLDSCNDDKVATILQKLEKARECMAEGIPLSDAGLIADTRAHLDQLGAHDHE